MNFAGSIPVARSTLVLDRSVAEAWKSYDLVHILRRAPDGQS